MERLFLAFAASCLLGAVADQASAQGQTYKGFKTPSGNIHCMLDDFGTSEGRPVSLRCDVMEVDGRLPKAPSWCDLDWGHAFSIGQHSEAGEMMCVGDSISSDEWLVLDYGGVWQQYGFTCTSATSGLTCTNPRGHGFMLSRAKQKLF